MFARGQEHAAARQALPGRRATLMQQAWIHRGIRLSIPVLWLFSATLHADLLKVEVVGLEGALLENVRAYVDQQWVSAVSLANERRRARFLKATERKAAVALRPHGYFFPDIESQLTRFGDATWRLELRVRQGEPMRIRDLQLEVRGDGSSSDDIKAWKSDWPLLPGTRLDQQAWEALKQSVLEITEEQGYLSAAFADTRIELDLEANHADLFLSLDTGPRAVIGDIVFLQDVVKDAVLEPLPRFSSGDYYHAHLVEWFRTDLWRTGFFENIDVVEVRRLDQEPPRVDFRVSLTGRNRNTHQGTLGYGTDSQVRVQYRWQRHLLSERGDAFAVAAGWQQRNRELLVFGEYRLPRLTRYNQHWLLGAGLKTEDQELVTGPVDVPDQSPLARGRVENVTLRAGKSRQRNMGGSRERMIETMYIEHLLEDSSFDPVTANVSAASLPYAFLFNGVNLADSTRSLVLGIEWDWPVIRGARFNTSGHHQQAWLKAADGLWGSQQSFAQAYLSSRWNFLLSDHLKLLLRGEVGYSDADVRTWQPPHGETGPVLSLTGLPFLYRFKAGGSRSVRGYGFDILSNNGVGSNHILTASVEMAYQFRRDWSLAAFYDVGNAFNDWSKTDLKRGLGVGVRWYTIAGAIRVDVAQAQDIRGKPWQLHLTIGSPLL